MLQKPGGLQEQVLQSPRVPRALAQYAPESGETLPLPVLLRRPLPTKRNTAIGKEGNNEKVLLNYRRAGDEVESVY